MASRELLTRSEEGLVRALVDLSAEHRVAPRAGFAASLRDRLVAEAAAIEAEEADAFQLALEGGTASGETAVLAGFATALTPATPMRAPVSLRMHVRDQLVAATREAPVTQAQVLAFDRARTRRNGSRTFATRLSRRLAMAAALSAMVVSSSAVAMVASAKDTPVDSLYGVKRFRERVQTWFISGTDEGMRRLRFADTRVVETETMVARGVTDPEPFEIALDGLQVELTLAAELIIEAHRGGDPAAEEAVEELARFITDGSDRLQEIEPALPEAVQPVADDALSVFEAAAERTDSAVDGCLICSPNPLVPSSNEPGDGCPSCGTGDPEGNGDGNGSGGVITRPNPRGTDRDPDGNGNQDPDDEGPLPDDPIPTPLPEPDRIPDLPGRIDDELEDLASRAATELLGSV